MLKKKNVLNHNTSAVTHPYTHTHTHTHMCIHTNTHTHTHTYTDTDTRTHKHTHTRTYTHTSSSASQGKKTNIQEGDAYNTNITKSVTRRTHSCTAYCIWNAVSISISNLNLQSQSHWTLFDETWHTRPTLQHTATHCNTLQHATINGS